MLTNSTVEDEKEGKGREGRKEYNDKRDRIGLVRTDREFAGDEGPFDAARGEFVGDDRDTVPFHKMAHTIFAKRRPTGIAYIFGSFASSLTLATPHFSHPHFMSYRVTLI